MIDLSPPPRLFVPQAPAIIQAAEPWERDAHRRLVRLGVPRHVRRAVVAELQRLVGVRKAILQPTFDDLARYGGPAVASFLPGMAGVAGMMGGGAVAGTRSLMDAITTAGLTANLVFCHDVAKGTCYTSGQSILDLSGNGHDFFLGTTVGAEATDPTFVGTPDFLTSGEYFLGDGGDCFTYDTTNPAAFNNPHKENAALTIITSLLPITGQQNSVLGTGGNVLTSSGVAFRFKGTDKLTFEVSNESGSAFAFTATADSASTMGAFNVIGCSINEAGGNVSFLWQKGAYLQVGASNTFDAAYTSPTANAATYTMQMGAVGNSQLLMPNGMRIAQIAMWSSALTKANLDAIYADAAVQTRYGL
jgi:hypothetical protein